MADYSDYSFKSGDTLQEFKIALGLPEARIISGAYLTALLSALTSPGYMWDNPSPLPPEKRNKLIKCYKAVLKELKKP